MASLDPADFSSSYLNQQSIKGSFLEVAPLLRQSSCRGGAEQEAHLPRLPVSTMSQRKKL